MLGPIGIELPPSIEETDECAQLACFRMADVTVIHSVRISAIGSTAILLDPIVFPLVYDPSMLLKPRSMNEEESWSCIGSSDEPMMKSCP